MVHYQSTRDGNPPVSRLAATHLRVAPENIYGSQGPLRETLRGRNLKLRETLRNRRDPAFGLTGTGIASTGLRCRYE